jgi:predicted nucleic acid-binding protein
MSGKAFVDTNILVYAHDQEGGRKTAQAQALLKDLWQENRGVISTQVLEEFCVNVRRKFRQPMKTTQVREAILLYGNWRTIMNSAESILRALDIEECYKLPFWDAMIVQAAQRAGCAVLYSEDLSNGQEYEGVLVVNPFEA